LSTFGLDKGREDIRKPIPPVAAAALGHALFGTLDVSIITSVLIGAIPAVMLGAHVSSKSADRYIRRCWSRCSRSRPSACSA
jgi:ABC-type nitrate/sulfonate/bicarbonate transport system permease component